ncbi:hypothetical protein [Lacipirellula limnantheis]|uniref:hypothetical protein n=1 Tax=Lacipirellula limnantheis TaxID=2528024 RepID=UPI00119F7A00|nr:hypothetical protein [Lacipirellula limnantheis]
MPNFYLGNGMTEMHLQYPFSETGASLDNAIQGSRIRAIPEPATLQRLSTPHDQCRRCNAVD